MIVCALSSSCCTLFSLVTCPPFVSSSAEFKRKLMMLAVFGLCFALCRRFEVLQTAADCQRKPLQKAVIVAGL